MVTGGVLTKDGAKSFESQFSAKELTVLVDEAHQAGVPVAAHAHGADGIAAAVEAGVDIIEHCTWMTATGLDLRQDVLKRILERSITICPAVSPHWPMLPKIFHEERAEAMFDLVRQMAEAGVQLIAGTDAGVQRAGFDGLVPALGLERPPRTADQHDHRWPHPRRLPRWVWLGPPAGSLPATALTFSWSTVIRSPTWRH